MDSQQQITQTSSATEPVAGSIELRTEPPTDPPEPWHTIVHGLVLLGGMAVLWRLTETGHMPGEMAGIIVAAILGVKQAGNTIRQTKRPRPAKPSAPAPKVQP